MKVFVLILILCLSLLGNCDAQSLSRNTINSPVVLTGENYEMTLKSIEAERQNLAAEYRRSLNKKEFFNKARQTFIKSIDAKLFPFWYGTDWDFYGTTQIPKEGKIACGYFVTTVLRDAGLRVQRVSLAQQASENIIKSLTTAPHIKRFRNTPIETFVAELKNSGAGLYIVGLDNHVGFILNDDSEVYFVHSSYVEPSEVIREKALTSPILSSSKYRVTGKISGDDALILKWLNQTPVSTMTR